MKKEKKRKNNRQSGAAMLISVVFFLFISLATIAGLVNPTVREFKNSSVNLNSKKSYFLAESGGEDALYRVLNSMTIDGTEVLTIDNNSATTTITSPSGNDKQITAEGDVDGLQRKTDVAVTSGGGVGFNYGLQIGNGGVSLDGGSTITGSIYSNGSINAISSTITGSATAADGPALTLSQSNELPLPPPSSITFRNVSGAQDYAQSFQLTENLALNKVQFYIKKVGAPANATVRLVADNNGSPSTTTIPIGTVTLTAASVTTSFTWIETIFTSFPSLMPNVKYWIVIDNGSQSSSNYFVIGANADTSYSSGTAKTGAYSGTWNATNLDSYFRIYTGGISALIGGAAYVGGVVIGGEAWAHVVKGASVAGSLYCTTGTFNNKACNTSKGIPPQLDMPFTDQNITDWKNSAALGGTITGATKCPGGYSSGNCTVNYAGATFGPGKITGNLVVNGGGTLTLTGTVWVVGTITVTAGGNVRLPSNYTLNSETIISDSYVILNGGSYTGSGTTGSYLFVVSTSRCPYDTYCAGNKAITVSGGSGAIAVDAENGDVSLSGGAGVKAATGNSMTVTGGFNVTYDTGLASPSFINGPVGSWIVETWKEVE